MSEQSQPSSPQPQSTPDPQTPVTPPANPGGGPQQVVPSPSLQSQPSSPQPQSMPDPQTPVTPPANPGGEPQQVVPSPSLPISPFTGEPYDPAWGVPLQKGGGNEQTIQQIVKHEIERKVIQSDGEEKK